MPGASDGWCADVTRELAKLLLEALPPGGAWVTLDWLVCRTHLAVTIPHATANFARHATNRGYGGRTLSREEEVALGHRWLITDALRNHCDSGRVEWQNHKLDDRRYRRGGVARPDGLPAESEIVTLPIASLNVEGETQFRLKLNEDRVKDIADAYGECQSLPPLRVVREGDVYWLADGFARRKALKRLGRSTAECELSEGTLKQARAIAAAANREAENSPYPLSREERRRAVEAVLRDFPHWSDRRIAEWVGVDCKTVAAARGANCPPREEEYGRAEFPHVHIPPGEVPDSRREGADGKCYPSTAKKAPEREILERQGRVWRGKSQDGKTLAQIAKEEGVAHITIRRDFKAARERAGAAAAPPGRNDDRPGAVTPAVSEATSLLDRGWEMATPAERDQFCKRNGLSREGG